MENSSSNNSLFDLSFDNNVKSGLRDLAVWAGLAAIVSLINSIFGLISYFIQMNKISNVVGDYPGTQRAMAGGMIMPLISLGIGVALFIFLNKFSRMAKAGVDNNDSYQINESLGNLSTYFKFVGILIIIVLVIFLLLFMFGLAMGA